MGGVKACIAPLGLVLLIVANTYFGMPAAWCVLSGFACGALAMQWVCE
jgi:hypothetical protein